MTSISKENGKYIVTDAVDTTSILFLQLLWRNVKENNGTFNHEQWTFKGKSTLPDLKELWYHHDYIVPDGGKHPREVFDSLPDCLKVFTGLGCYHKQAVNVHEDYVKPWYNLCNKWLGNEALDNGINDMFLCGMWQTIHEEKWMTPASKKYLHQKEKVRVMTLEDIADAGMTTEDRYEGNVTMEDIFGADFIADVPRTREPLSNSLLQKLRQFETTNFDENYLEGTTFQYIHMYVVRGVEHPRLKVALTDIGYTKDELDANTISQIVTELLSREQK